jgi:hypothetical protein
VRTPVRVSWTWSLSAEKRFSESVEASCTWLEMRQNASAIKREGQQGDGGQAPVDAEEHDAQHHHQGQRAVEAGQQRLARGLFDGVDVVGGERHQVAGALALVEGRTLRRQAPVQTGAQFDAEAVGGRIQAQAPGHAQP